MIDEIDNELKDMYYEDLIIIEAKTEKSREIAIKLLNNLNLKFISQITDLPIEEIRSLTKHAY
jgi:hypothetical protein